MHSSARFAGAVLALLWIASACGGSGESSGAGTGTLRVTITTTGTDPDPDGFMLQVGTLPGRTIPGAGSTEEFQIEAGSYSVQLIGLALNCQVTGGIPPAQVSADQTTELALPVSCSALPGAVRVTAATAGEDVDLNGYHVLVDGVVKTRVPANGSVVVASLAAGPHTVTLDENASNCLPDGASEVDIEISHSVEAGAGFGFTCQHTEKLAFTSSGTGILSNQLYSANQDGSGLSSLTSTPNGVLGRPAWSGDGTKLAYTVGDQRIWIISADGTPPPQPLPLGSIARNPAWSLDGQRLAYECQTSTTPTAICTADPSGGDIQQLTGSDTMTDTRPSWSPDGSRIVFVRDIRGLTQHLYIMNANGTGVVQLTDSLVEDWPVWSPDGTRIAFTEGTAIQLIHPDGTGREYLQPAISRTPAGSPAWGPGGLSILAVSGPSVFGVDLATRLVTFTMVFPGVEGIQALTTRP